MAENASKKKAVEKGPNQEGSGGREADNAHAHDAGNIRKVSASHNASENDNIARMEPRIEDDDFPSDRIEGGAFPPDRIEDGKKKGSNWPTLANYVIMFLTLIYPATMLVVYMLQLRYYKTRKDEYMSFLRGLTEEDYNEHVAYYSSAVRDHILVTLCIFIAAPLVIDIIVRVIHRFLIEGNYDDYESEDLAKKGFLYSGLAVNLLGVVAIIFIYGLFTHIVFGLIAYAAVLAVTYFLVSLIKPFYTRCMLRFYIVTMVEAVFIMFLFGFLNSDALLSFVSGYHANEVLADPTNPDLFDTKLNINAQQIKTFQDGNRKLIEILRDLKMEDVVLGINTLGAEFGPGVSVRSFYGKVICFAIDYPQFASLENYLGTAMHELGHIHHNHSMKITYFNCGFTMGFALFVSMIILLLPKRYRPLNSLMLLMWLSVLAAEIILSITNTISQAHETQADDYAVYAKYGRGLFRSFYDSIFHKKTRLPPNFYAHRGHAFFFGEHPSFMDRMDRIQKQAGGDMLDYCCRRRRS